MLQPTYLYQRFAPPFHMHEPSQSPFPHLICHWCHFHFTPYNFVPNHISLSMHIHLNILISATFIYLSVSYLDWPTLYPVLQYWSNRAQFSLLARVLQQSPYKMDCLCSWSLQHESKLVRRDGHTLPILHLYHPLQTFIVCYSTLILL